MAPTQPDRPEAGAASWTPLMDALPQGVLLTDRTGRCLEANDAAVRILGVDRATLLAHGLAGPRGRLITPDGAVVGPADFPSAEALRTGAPVRRTLGWVLEQRAILWLQLGAEPLPGGGALVSFEDITQRVQAEAALRLSEEKFSKAFHASPDSITITRLADGAYLALNEGFSRITGYSAEEVLGRSALPGDLGVWARAEDRARFQELMQRDGSLQDQEYEFRRKNGQPYTGLVSASLIQIQRETCVLAIKRDVTGQRSQARQLERMSRLYAALSQVNQAIVWSATAEALLAKICEVMVVFGRFSMAWVGWDDPGSHEVRVLAQCGDQAGYLAGLRVRSDDSPLGRGNVGTAIREQRTCVENDVAGSVAMAPWRAAADQAGYAAMVAIPIRKAGAVCGALTVYSCEPGFFSGQEVALLEEAAGDIAFALDNLELASQREQALAALAESEARFNLAFRFMPVALGITRVADGHLLAINQAFEAMFGYTLAELEGKDALQTGLWAFPGERAAMLAQLQAGGTVRDWEARIRRKDGSLRWISAYAETVTLHGVPCLLSGAMDITARKAADDTIRRLAGDLEQRVSERTAQLEAANRELEAFSYSVSHDLRAPLRSIDGFSQALLEDCAPLLDGTGRDYLGRIRAGTQRMAQLIEDLLKLSQLNRNELSMGEVDLSSLAGTVHEGLCRSAPDRQVALSIQPGLRAHADGRLILVVLENLLGNAWKFTARRPEPRIELGGVDAAHGEQLFFIRDNGAGFDMAQAGRLFNAFQRLHTAAEYEGTGIGLAIVQRIIHRHLGRVWAEAEPGRGATFWFALPGGPGSAGGP